VFNRQSKLRTKYRFLVLEVDRVLLQIRESWIQTIRAEEVLPSHQHCDVLAPILERYCTIDVVCDQLQYDLLLVLGMFPQNPFRLLCHVYRGVCINRDPITELVRLPYQRTSLDLSILVVRVWDMH
jgi:hypothetical protein